MRICSNAKRFLFLFWYWNLTWIQSVFCLSAAVTKRYQSTQDVENSLRNTPPRVRRSEKNCQAAEEESYPGEIELEKERNSEDLRST